MPSDNSLILRRYLENTEVDILLAKHGRCPEQWRMLDFISTFNRLYYIESGEGWINIDGKDFYPKPGQLVLMPHGLVQSFSKISTDAYFKFWCHFTALTGHFNLFDRISTPYCVDVEDKDYVRVLFEKIVSSFSNTDIFAPLIAKGALLELLAYFFQSSDSENISLCEGQHINELENTVRFIEENLSEKITVDSLAKQVHLNPCYFTKLFKKHFDLPPTQYVNKRRLEKAKHYLTSTNATISEIAELTGFCNVFYFSQAFKKSSGLSPSEFRDLNFRQD